MNISRISINDFGKWQNFQLDNLNSGLNVIYGRNGSGKTTIRHFLRGMLQGFDTTLHNQFLEAGSHNAGNLEIKSNHDRIQLDHHRINGVDEIRSKIMGGTERAAIANEFTRKVDSATFDQILNVGFRNQANDASALATVLHNRFRVPYGRTEKPRIDEVLVREREAVVAGCRELIAELKRRREYLIGQISDRDHSNSAVRDDLTRQINALSDRIRESESSIESMQRRVRDLDISIDELRAHIDRLRNQVDTIRISREANQLPELLARLDAIEQQIVRWKKVHHDVQGQRGKLRDEMVSWTAEDLSDRELLPYEDVRKLLGSLEGRVGDLDGFVARLDRNGTANRDETNNGREHYYNDVTGSMRQTVTSMREELYQLCRELNAQHQVYRRKTIVNELKQLRRCHAEVSDHIERLVSRRESVIDAIEKLDPARGQLIRKSGHELCGCNYHDQYLSERQTTPRETYVERRVEVDVSSELARLHLLEDDRRRLIADIGSTTADTQDLIRRRDELIRRRDHLQLEDVEGLRRELTDIERRLSPENLRYEEALRQLEAARRVPEYRPNPLLENASRFLQQMTAGELQQIWLTEDGDGIQASDRAGRSITNSRLSRSGKDQVRLSVSLAATQALHAEGIDVPLVLDDALVNIDEQSQRDTAQVLIDFCKDGIQVIMFTCHRQVANLMAGPGVTVLELPEYEQRGTVAPPVRFEQVTATPVFTPLKHDHPTARTDVTLNLYRDAHAYDYIEPDHLTTRTLVDTAQYLNGDIRRNPSPRRNSTVASASLTTSFDEATHLADTGLMGSDNIALLRRLGVRTLGDLLNFDPTTRFEELADAGIDLDRVDAWQAQSLLLLTIPQLRGTDAVMLYRCGLTDAEKISNLNVDQLNDRIRDFADSTRGRRMFASGYSYDSNQLGSWINSARDNRDRYRNRRRWTHRGRSPLIDRQESSLDRAPRTFAGGDSDNARCDRNRDRFRDDRSRSDREYAPRAERTGSERSPNERSSNDRSSNERTREERSSSEREKAPRSSQDTSRAMKFYLELDNNIESAPSIGPRMAERLEKIGINSVRDLLEETPENIAKQLDYKRVKANDVRAWQQQSTLVCRIPQLRGHDAQFLVACDVTDADTLASMEPEALYKVVGPFAKTREGQKICRSGKMPDLAEIKDWISWAQQTRALKAA